MTITVQCPLDDCTSDFEKDTREEAENSVVAHVTSSKGIHEGIGYQKARTLLDLEDISDTDVSEDISDNRETTDNSDSNGLGLGGPPEPSTGDDDPSDGVDGADSLTCTGCADDLDVSEEELREEFGDEAVRLNCSCGETMRWSA